jgi:hypothetical protein
MRQLARNVTRRHDLYAKIGEPDLIQPELRMGLSIVVPTRDDPDSCIELLIALMVDNVHLALPLSVLFLVNDTVERHTASLERVVSDACFSPLRPRLLRAGSNFLTCEESILDTLGKNLDAVDSYFLIIGNSDRVMLAAVPAALRYMQEHALDLLLVGVVNREIHQGKVVRQQSMTPRHLNSKNRLGVEDSWGSDIFSEAMSDYGPEGYAGYLGCQIYSKQFFQELCPIVAAMPEPLWALAFGTLELTTQKQWRVGYTPEILAMRIDRLLYGADSGEHPPDWWPIRSRTERGFSKHLTLTMISNSLELSAGPFQTLVNAQLVTSRRGSSQYEFSNFLFAFVEQMRNLARECFRDRGYQYSWSELRDIIRFGKRLGTVEIGLPAEEHACISTWLQSFGVIGDYSNPQNLHGLMASADAVLTLLDRRPGMERWIASLQPSPLVMTA